MHGYMDGWNWMWMTLMVAFWVVLIGAVVYIAVRLAQRPTREGKP
jgi:heme/copper-type cytochrome/quinol oxidase subunit 2